MEKPEPWLSVEEIASHLGVSKETVYRWLDRQAIPAHRIGRQWRFQAREVDEWVRRGEATENFGVNAQGADGGRGGEHV